MSNKKEVKCPFYRRGNPRQIPKYDICGATGLPVNKGERPRTEACPHINLTTEGCFAQSLTALATLETKAGVLKK